MPPVAREPGSSSAWFHDDDWLDFNWDLFTGAFGHTYGHHSVWQRRCFDRTHLAALPESPEKRLFSVDAGIATVEQFRAATERDALVGRLRKNVTVRRTPAPKRPGKRGRPARHGPVLHPGAHMGAGAAAGIEKIARSLDQIHAAPTSPV